MQIRHSWRKGRAMLAARTVLSALSPAERERLLDEFVDRGGGLEMFLEREAEHFLAFLEARLPRPSRALTLCHMQQAVHRARLGASTFAPPEPRVPTGPIRRGRYAAMIRFHADEPMMALNGAEAPPVDPAEHPVLFGPGLPNLFRFSRPTMKRNSGQACRSATPRQQRFPHCWRRAPWKLGDNGAGGSSGAALSCVGRPRLQMKPKK